MSKLKPCPFCGCKTIERWPMDGGKWESPVCLHCGATIHENFDTPKDTEAMIKAWNRRAPDPEKQVMQDDIAFLNGRVRQLANFDYMAEKERMRWEHQREKQELLERCWDAVIDSAEHIIMDDKMPLSEWTTLMNRLRTGYDAALLRHYEEKRDDRR